MILESMVQVIGLILIGSLMRKSPWFPDNTANVLNSFVLNISLPAIIMVSIPKLVINAEILYPVLLHWIAFSLHVGILILLAKWMKLKKSIFGVMLIVTTLGNTAFLGIPLVKSFYGSPAVPYAVLYDQLGSGIGFIIFGAFVLPIFTGAKKRSMRDVLKGLFTFPAFLALLAGFSFHLVELPDVINNFLEIIAATLIPCAMMAVGFQMKYRLEITELKTLALGLWLKLILVPLILLLVVKSSFPELLPVKVGVLQSAMPPMITAGAMAIDAGLEKNLAAAFVGYGLIASFAVLPLLNMLL